MKLFFMRFFTHRDLTIPYDSWALCSGAASVDDQKMEVETRSDHIVNWFKNHPNGKVDFVWL